MGGAININTVLLMLVIFLLAYNIFNSERAKELLRRIFPKPDMSMFQKRIHELEMIIDGMHLKEKEQRTQIAVMNESEKILGIGSWLWIMDRQTDEVVMSANFLDIFNSLPPNKSVTAADIMEVVHVDDRPRVNEVMAKSFDSGEPYKVEYRIIKKNHRIDLIEATGVPIKNDNGKTVQIKGAIKLLKTDVD